MAAVAGQWEFALDEPRSADAASVRKSVGFALAVGVLAVVVVGLGDRQLAAWPQFVAFHGSFILLVDSITALILLGQVRYRRKPSYLVLGCAYAFTALLMLPFLLSFPGTLLEAGTVIGGTQSSIWIWQAWHLLFPLLVAAALAMDARFPDAVVPDRGVEAAILASLALAVAFVVATAAVVTRFHDALPVLIDGARRPMTNAFYGVGILTAAATATAMLMAGRRGWRDRSALHLWLAVALAASLADVAASLAAYGRYTVGWYFGRVESMIAGSVLLAVFIGEINRLYHRLAVAMRDVSAANLRLVATLDDKDALLAELRRSEEQVRQLAYHDTLTGLPNRRLLLDRINVALSQAKRHRYSMAIMFLDLDRFKHINDTLGHDVGDELLRQVAARLSACMRRGDTASRSGGDEFIVLLAEIAHPEDAARVAEKLIVSLNDPVEVGDHRLYVTTSIGIAIYPLDAQDDMQELMKKADRAMYAAKAAGRNQYRFYGDVEASLVK